MRGLNNGFLMLLLVLFSLKAFGQLPKTNIYSLDIRSNEQKVLFSELTLLTHFNIDGYNNQPHFVDDRGLLITSNFNSQGLTDIWHLNLANQEITRITKTEESEYSPTIMASGIDFSVIRQELDDSQPVPQILWSYPLDRSTHGKIIPTHLTNIGYHVWLSQDKVALYLVGTPSELILLDLSTNSTTHIAKGVGRCLKVNKSGLLFYLQTNDTGGEIRSYDPYLGRSKKIAKAIDGQQDFDILPNGHLISSQGAILKTFRPFISADWEHAKDLSGTGIQKITRITSSRNKLAIVTSN